MKVSIEQLEKSFKRYYKPDKDKIRPTVENISSEDLLSTFGESIPKELIEGNIIGEKKNLTKRLEMIREQSIEPVDFAFERAIGRNDSVYSNFIDLIFDAKKKVGRIVKINGIDISGYATGFMVSNNLLLTNWHVFETINDVDNSVIQFNYELDINGKPSEILSFKLSADLFYSSFKELDYCFVGVEPISTDGKHNLKDIGYIELNPNMGKLGNEDVELLNIIHHPNGDYKQISIRENKFTKILATTIWYESDTAQGSSGSPVFNDQFQVVAIHHMGIAKQNEQEDYIDSNGEVIPIINGKIDISRVVWIANEGIRISLVCKHLKSNFPNSKLVQEVFTTSMESKSYIEQNLPVNNNNIANIIPSNSAVHISIPSTLIENQKNFSFNFSTNSTNTQNNESTFYRNSKDDDFLNIQNESLRLERSMDYSPCRGYQSDFLGHDIRVSIPKPKNSVKNQMATFINSSAYILKYFKYSVIFNKLKKMPFISAINVDGAESKRQDRTKRNDVWIRDNRIDLQIQLSNDFYYKSGFDRGHMSRREDGNWGDSPEEAKRNADFTCIHTNACPQVPSLNRSNKRGLWGKLEKIILEKGAKKELGELGKISVFSGPIFRQKDPFYKGVKIPMEFYKIILWLNNNEYLKATAFILSQSDLVTEIDFEDIGIDQNVTFKEYQCSIEKLQSLTQLDFSKFIECDTFQGNEENIEIIDEAHLIEIIKN